MVTTLEEALAFDCGCPTDEEAIEVVKAFAAGLRTMRPDNAGPLRVGVVGAGPTGICWAIETKMPNLFEEGETIHT